MEERHDARDWTCVTIVSPVYPNVSEEREIRRQLSGCHILHNILIDEGRMAFIEGRHTPDYKKMCTMITSLRRDVPDLDGINVYTLRDAAARAEDSFEDCNRRNSLTRELILPGFKALSRYRSIVFNPNTFGIKGTRVNLSSKLNVRARNLHAPKGGEPLTVRLCLDGRERWMLHVPYMVKRTMHNEEFLENPLHPEAFDLGLTHEVTDTRGNTITRPKYYAKERDRIARIQRRMSELEEGSPAWMKLSRKLGRIHHRVRSRRDGEMNRIAEEVVRDKSIVFLEDLDVKRLKEMDVPPEVRDMYTDASLAKLVEKIKRRADRLGVKVVLVNPAYTTRTCSECGHVREAIPTFVRTFVCPECGHTEDRDRNAAKNIIKKGSGTGSWQRGDRPTAEAEPFCFRQDDVRTGDGILIPPSTKSAREPKDKDCVMTQNRKTGVVIHKNEIMECEQNIISVEGTQIQTMNLSSSHRARKTNSELKTEIKSLLRDHGAMSMRELTDALGYSRNSQNVYRAVRDLVMEGTAEYTLPDRMSSRNQRIRLRF